MMRSAVLVVMVAVCYARSVGVKLESGNLERHALLHLPPESSQKPGSKLPLVVNLHFLGGNPLFQAILTGFNRIADKEGFAVVYPRGYDIAQPLSIHNHTLPFGTPETYSWNAGACCPHANTRNRNDTQFIRDLLAKLQAEHDIDETRIYATGMSNGGFFTNRLACEARELFAAIAPVSGPIANNTSPAWGGGDAYSCDRWQQGSPLPVLYIQGDQDPLVRWDGFPRYGFPSIPHYIDTVLRLNGLDPKIENGTVSFAHKDVECTSHGQRESNVTLCRIKGAGHSWPGATICPPKACSKTISATDQIWNFFKRYSLQKSVVMV
jgi:polyhydroxybutyrate depolymerase